MPDPSSPTSAGAESTYRLAPAVAARLVGGVLILFALLLVVVTLVVALAGLPLAVLAIVVLVGVAGALVGGQLLARRLAVVRFDADGYRVRLVRGVGVSSAAWSQVAEAVTATPQGVPVVTIKLDDGRTTTIPVTVLAVDREQFVRDLQGYLQRGQGLRPLG